MGDRLDGPEKNCRGRRGVAPSEYRANLGSSSQAVRRYANHTLWMLVLTE